jgi:hypothetical protein
MGGGKILEMILINSKLQIGKRGQKTELTVRSQLRRWMSALDCSAIEEEKDVNNGVLNFEVHLSQLSSHCELDSSVFVFWSKKYWKYRDFPGSYPIDCLKLSLLLTSFPSDYINVGINDCPSDYSNFDVNDCPSEYINVDINDCPLEYSSIDINDCPSQYINVDINDCRQN